MKYDEKEQVTKFKARLVIQSFLQIYKVNYNEMFAFTVCRESLKIFLTLVALYNLKLH